MRQVTFWLDWEFWQVIVAAVAAVLGFFGGTVFTHSLDRRRDREVSARRAVAEKSERLRQVPVEHSERQARRT
jgi:hypothetical protein